MRYFDFNVCGIYLLYETEKFVRTINTIVPWYYSTFPTNKHMIFFFFLKVGGGWGWLFV